MMPKTTAEFVAYLHTLDIRLRVEDDSQASFPDRDVPLDQIRLRCTAPEGGLTAELRQELADRKAELIMYLCAENGANGSQKNRTDGRQAGKTRVLPFSAPLSFAQQRLWFLYQLAPNNSFYNVPAAIRLQGRLDQKALERSFREIVQRHAALRTTFTAVDGQPVQVVEPEVRVDLSIVNLQTVAIKEREHISQQIATAEAQRPFNLTTDPLLRVTLLQFGPTEVVLLLTMHHIVADGWSLGVLIQELACCYRAFVEGRSPELPPLPIQYADFAVWQRNWLQGEVLEKQLNYWRKQLQDLPALNLPSDRPRPRVQTYRGATYPLQISPALTQSLAALSQQSGTSLFMTLLAAFQTLLYRYTGQEDIAIGSPIANRPRSELEGLIGFFVNSLVMRLDLSGNPTFRELLQRVRRVALEAYEHQDLPFEKLVEELDPDRDLSRNPLFQVAFALQNAPVQPLELPGLTLKPDPLELGSARFDLEVHLWEPAHGLRSLWQSQEGLSGFIAYSTDLFDSDRIARLAGHFQTLLEGIVAHPEARLSALPLLTAGEWQQTVVDWNQTGPLRGTLRDDRCFHHIFEAQVQADPEAIAVVSERESLTYRELNQRADRLAQILRGMGVRPDALVGLCVDRSADLLVGVLGIFKAGGAYVPLDPTYPGERLRWMLSDAQPIILLTQSWFVELFPTSSVPLLCLDQLDVHPVLQEDGAPQESGAVTSEHLAYVIYTSGSTGVPKGVLLSHRGLGNVVEAQRQIFDLRRGSRVLQFSSLSFDASVFEIALALGSGSTLYIPPVQLLGLALVQFLEDNAITHALLTPSVLAVLPLAELPNLQVLITGGESCSSAVVDRWAVNRRFLNAYGPTESTIWATVAELHPGDSALTIGRPVLNTQIYILDAHLNPVPVGIPGELYIGGAGLARGYLHRPALTAERFVHVELNNASLLYRTGDRALYRADGTVEFLGRVDHQIQIRGVRVELGEIEATLQHHPALREVAVLPSGESAQDLRLIAYFSLDRQIQSTLRQSLQAQQIQHWQDLYNQTYRPSDPCSPDPQPFNITGWNSSYTGAPIPSEQMQEWVSDRVQQILALRPKRVLEIGCGTGLLLFQIAPHCQQYVGTDFSAVSLQTIQRQLCSANLPQVELVHCMATDFEGMTAGSFDVVILNSIVQYFPDVDYLMQVLEGVMRAVAPQGVVFVGDVRSLPLLRAFHTWVKFSQADGSLERTQLRQQVERAQFEEPELAIDPRFFQRLQEAFPQIEQVQIRLARGHSQNEMTQFRYNVLLQVGDCRRETDQSIQYSLPSVQKHLWKLNPVSVEEIKESLIEAKTEILMIVNVVNRRVNAAVRTATWLYDQEAPKTVGRMRDLLRDTELLSVNGIDPQSWWDLEAILPYDVEITWSTSLATGDYDVLLVRQGINARIAARIAFPAPPLDSGWHHYTNHPLQSNFAHQLIPELRQYLRGLLPDVMIPSAFVPLETLPLTVNGKVDRQALSRFDEALQDLSNPAIAPSTSTELSSTELTLVEIWQELLRLKQVNIHANFFEMGGHSLLATQMISRVRDVLGLELPLQKVFEAPTIAQLAPILEDLRDTASTPKVPPLVRLDRSAYRRRRVVSDGQQDALAQEPLRSEHEAITEPAIASNSPLVPLTLGGNKPPFFCVHPMFGVVFPYLELAHCLENDRSFYGLQPLGLDGKHPPLTQIEAIAAYYIAAIRTLQPHGPYILGGWSFGGLVAFEMAQQLTQAGQEIALLAIFDTPAPNYQPSPLQRFKFLLGTALWSTLPFLLDYGAIAAQRLRGRNLQVSRWQWSAILRLMPEESRLQLLDESAILPMLRIAYANAQAAYRYVPQSYAHRITLFKAAEQSDAAGQDSALGWSHLATDIQLHLVPGNHLSLLKQPHVQTLAHHLGQCLGS